VAFSCSWEDEGRGRVTAAQIQKDIARILGLKAKETECPCLSRFQDQGIGELWVQRGFGVLDAVCTASRVATSEHIFSC